MCLELMIERAKENVALGGINICVSSLERLPVLESCGSAHNAATAPCVRFSPILMEDACAQQLQYKSLCLLIRYYLANFIIIIIIYSCICCNFFLSFWYDL